MVAVAAAFALLLLVFQGVRSSDQAIAQASKEKKDDVGVIVASGDQVEGRTAKGTGAGAMPQTGGELEKPIMLGLVLLLDGTLAFLVTSRRHAHTPI